MDSNHIQHTSSARRESGHTRATSIKAIASYLPELDPKEVDVTNSDSSIAKIAKEHNSPDNKLDIKYRVGIFWKRYKIYWCLVLWLLLTSYFVVSLALKRKTQLSDLLPLIFLYIFISAKMLFAFTGTAFVSRPTSFAFKKAMHQVLRLPQSARYIASVIILLAIVLAVSLGLPESSGNKRINRMQSFLGIIFILALLVLTSKNRSQIQWRTVIVGFLLQFCLGCVVVKTKWGTDFFTWLATIASSLLEFARYGTKFLFGDDVGGSAIFAVSVFPAIIFFSAFIQMTTYLGGAQWLLRNLGWLFLKMLNTSGVESIVAAASPFFGQSENVLLVKDYLEHMTKSEIHACMTAGFATISGSTLQGYIVLGVNAANIITACIMSIPCSLALSKIRYPETEVPLTRGKIVEPPRCTSEVNIIHAISSGAALGMNLSLLIAANLIAIIALVNLADFFFTWFGQFIAINNLTLELILGYILYPYTWLLGVSNKDVLLVSQLLGLKFVANEFVAYQRLTDESKGPSISSQLTDRSRVIAEFALCGFGNLGGIAQQIGAFGALAPSRKADFSQLALSACITGSIATTITAAIISMVM